MNKYTAAQARIKFSEIINRAAFGQERILITKNGKVTAAIIPAETLALLTDLEDHLDLEVARKSLMEAKKKGTKSWNKLKAELNLEKK